MYWLNGIASELSLECTVKKDLEEPILDIKESEHAATTFSKSLNVVSIQPSSHASLYITCTRNGIYLWSVKVKPIIL